MYYKIYGVMSASGFNTEEGTAATKDKALAQIKELDQSRYPFFSVTEHLTKFSPAIAIYVGVTKEGLPAATTALVEYKTNPMQNPDLAAKLFTSLKDKMEGKIL